MKTGKCKFGLTCKFHHPKDIQIPNAEVANGNSGQTETVNGNVTSSMLPYAPSLVQNSKGLPIRPVIHLRSFIV